MTENEALLSALKKVKEQKENFGFMDRFNVDENWEVMKALEEIQQYRAIGTIDEFKALKEKEERFDRNIKMFNEIGLEIRNKAIDEFAEKCKEHIFCQTFGLKPRNIDEIVEELKGVQHDK